MRTIRALLWTFAAVASTTAIGGQPATDEAARGRLLYRIHCLDCHGEAGTGNGPRAAELREHPTDLTLLSHDEGGTFPRDRLTRVIDGRDLTPGHGTRDMPVWGMTFIDRGRTEGQEDVVRDQIRALVDYLETLQKP